jgi:2-polyprenyl-3-methyl-5-hydroxy-6-metoxy-1,4-benzoquinol methylase
MSYGLYTIVAMDACRACGGATSVAFETLILGRYRVKYARCRACDSLQTEPPYWLAESYTSAIAATDTGAMIRNLVCHAAVYAVAAVCHVRGKLLDCGGGAGVLCRLLRDSGFDAYLSDKYADPIFARAFSVSIDECPPGSFALVSAVEVLEHYENPGSELDRLFALKPKALVATTQLYTGETQDWWYLARQTGQHVFFYSEKCLKLLAHRHGYDYFGVGWIHVFSARPLGPVRRIMLRVLLSSVGLGVIRLCLTAGLRGRFANQDSERVCRQLAARQSERSDD